jgi:hypothetical protein
MSQAVQHSAKIRTATTQANPGLILKLGLQDFRGSLSTGFRVFWYGFFEAVPLAQCKAAC